MSILTIDSSKHSLAEIFKRKTKDIFIDELRKGFIFSWLQNENTFRAYFEDNAEESSFNTQETTNYIDPTRYTSALSYNSILSEVAKRIVKNELSQQLGEYKITLHDICIKKFWYATHFQTHFPEYNLEFIDHSGNNFTLLINTKENLCQSVAFLQLLTFIFALSQNEPIDLNENNVDKYIKIAGNYHLSYFLIYLLKINLLNNKKIFDAYKERLENIAQNQINITFGDNHSQRRYIVESKLDFKYPIIDIGSGEGYFALQINRKYPELKYYAIDTDLNVQDILKRKIWALQIEQISQYDSIHSFLKSNDFSKTQKYDVIMSEVIEHMSIDDAKELLNQILSEISFNSIIITTPNKDFNQFYFETAQSRHEDHKFEMNQEEFEIFLKELTRNTKYEASYFQVGDVVDGISTSLGAKIEKLV